MRLQRTPAAVRLLAGFLLMPAIAGCAGQSPAGPGDQGAGGDASSNPSNPFGMMSTRPFGASDTTLVRDLGMRCYRPRPVLLQLGTGSADAASFDGLELILTVKNTTYPDSASTAPADPELYRRKIAEVIAAYGPAIIAIENEEDLPKFWAGSPEEYGAMLGRMSPI